VPEPVVLASLYGTAKPRASKETKLIGRQRARTAIEAADARADAMRHMQRAFERECEELHLRLVAARKSKDWRQAQRYRDELRTLVYERSGGCSVPNWIAIMVREFTGRPKVRAKARKG
jgi:hypothetical protein